MQYTPSQNKAINARGESILLSAGAGSGKTKVLVERIIKMITEEHISVEQLLVVTFTKAAAGEMKNRIFEALNQKLLQNPHDTYLQNQSLLLNNAAITTIHSFCLDLIRENYYLLDLDANCRVADETESYLLKEEALDEYLEYKYQQNDPLFRELLLRYGGREDEKIRQIIFMLYEQAISLPDYEKWLADLGEALKDTDFWLDQARQKAEKTLKNIDELLKKAIISCTEDEKCQKSYLAKLLQEQAQLDTAHYKISQSLDSFLEYLDKSEIFATALRDNKKASDSYRAAVAYYKQAKAAFSELADKLANAHSSQAEADLAEIYPFVNYFGKLTLGFAEYYNIAKCKRHLLDFDDMGHLALELLYQRDGSPSTISLELKERYQAVLIDEYQDTNDLQEKIMLAISREDNYFMVGDVKQSIYSFRMANPSLFQHKYESFAASQIIDMNKNFRSRRNIVTAVNDLFNILMPGGDENPDYQASAQMEFGAEYYEKENVPDKAVKVWRLQKPEKSSAAGNENTENTAEDKEAKDEKKEITREAELIAREIKKLRQSSQLIYDKNTGSYRQIEFRDIVIIMRAPSNGGGEIYEVLNNADIPCYLEKKSGYFASWEVQITLDILRVLDNPQQDLPLTAVLKAPFVGFTDYSDNELLMIRRLDEKKNMYECLEEAALAADELGDKARQTLSVLTKLRRLAIQCPSSELLLRVYQECHLPDYAAVLPQGAERRNNLEALYDKAVQYEQASFHGLFMFLTFLEQMQKKNQSIEPAPLLGENVDVVRIMSIHQSKGLEFPVVFIPKSGKHFHSKDYTSEILLDKNLGLILPNVDLKERVIYPTVCTEVLKERKKTALIAEEKRILYVAMTRAREHLYFIGLDNPSEDEDGCSYLDWLNLLPDTKLNADWEFRDLQGQEAELSDEKETEEEAEESDAFDTVSIDHELYQALSWQYPFQKQCYIPAKTSVTALNEKNKLDIHAHLSQEFKLPDFIKSDNKLSAAQKGTVMHTIMSQIDLKKNIDQAYLRELVAQLEYNNILPAESTAQIDLGKIESFFHTDLGQRLLKTENIYREQPFTLPVKVKAADDQECTVLVQGIIDCMWQEEGGWVLLDYKSNHINRQNTSKFIQNYQAQIELYAQAIREIWQEPLKAAYLYLFHTERAIEMKITE